MEDGSHLLELLEALEAGILVLERDPEADQAASVHRLFQSAHNLKSGLAMAEMTKASRLFHSLEDGLDDIRRGRLAWSPRWADLVLDTVDRVRACLDVGNDDTLDLELALSLFAGAEKAEAKNSLSPEESAAARQAASQGHGLYRIEKLFLPGLTRGDFEGHLIHEDIADNGDLVWVKPGWDEYSQADGEVVVRFVFSSPHSHEKLSDLFFDPLITLEAPPTRAPDAPQFRFLVVDDDALTAQLVKRIVEGFGEVTVAADGAQALKAFQSAFDSDAPIDVVILDLEMPEVDGHKALEGMRDYEESHGVLGLDRCLVFIHTSNPDLRKVKASFKLQADRYFIKPLSAEEIQKRLKQSVPWLERRRRGSL